MARRRDSNEWGSTKGRINGSGLRKLLGVFRFITPYATYFILGMVCLVLSSLTLLSFPYITGKLVDAAAGRSDWFINGIDEITILFVLLLAIQSVFSFGRIYFFAQMSERAMAAIRSQVFSRYMQLPMPFFDANRTGELISRLTSDVSQLQDTLSSTLGEFIRQVINLTVGIGIILFLFPSITLFMLAIFPVVILIAVFFGRYIRRLSRQTQDELARANVVAEEAISSVSVVKAFTNEFLEWKKYFSALKNVVHVALRAAVYRGGFVSFLIFVVFGAIVAVIWYGAHLVADGEMTVGQLLSFVFFTSFIGGSIASFSNIYGQIQRAIGASERLLALLEEPVEVPHTLDQERVGTTIEKPVFNQLNHQNIVFSDVHFSYPSRPEVEVIKGLNVSIQKGEQVALVGESGAGKSTLIQLLMRFYPLTSGQIKINGIPISEWELQTLRHGIGIVPQEVILFGGTVYENISYGNPDASKDQVMEAATLANASQFINAFPEKYDTIVGEKGIRLSGGQRQRIAIARAILKNPEILILDEATSSLDASSESLVQEALEVLMKGRTSIIIAHRLATVRKVDRIFVIDSGQLVEEGNHEELSSKTDGLYKKLAKLQFLDTVE